MSRIEQERDPQAQLEARIAPEGDVDDDASAAAAEFLGDVIAKDIDRCHARKQMKAHFTKELCILTHNVQYECWCGALLSASCWLS